MRKRHRVGGHLFFFPFLIPLLFGAAIAGIGPVQTQGVPKGCPEGSQQYGSCLCGTMVVGRIVCYEE